MYHPTTRVLTILELLQTYGTLSGAELARRLEVDRRTVRRYIVMLQDLGMPISTTRGPHGGYRLQPGFKLPPLMFNDDEALAVCLSLTALHGGGLALDGLASAGALAKIERVLPDELRTQLQALQSVVDFVPVRPAAQPDTEILIKLGIATRQQRRVAVHYRSEAIETVRRFDPYGMVVHWQRWYLTGYCHLRQDLRVLRVDRIAAAELTDASFTPPAGFDSLRHVLDRLAMAPWGWDVEVLLDTTLDAARRRVPAGTALLVEEGDGVVLRSNVDRLDRLARMLLMLECSFVIRRPQELRAALREVAATAAAIAEREEQ